MKNLKTVSLILLVIAVIILILAGWSQWGAYRFDIDVTQKDIFYSLAFVMLILSFITRLAANEFKKLEERIKKEIVRLEYRIDDIDK